MSGDRHGLEENSGNIHRQQSNWAEEVTSPSGEASDSVEVNATIIHAEILILHTW